jgi:hypothetical protein
LESKNKKTLDSIWKSVKSESKHFSVIELNEMLESNEAKKRLFALLLIRKQIEEGDSPCDYFDLAHKTVNDSDNNCRWQSLIIISELIEIQPDLVWSVILEYGDSDDDDMRTAIATVLLEHLLDFNFDKYFTKLREEILKGRNQFIDTLEMCWLEEKRGTNFEKVRSFLKTVKHDFNSNG